MKNILISKLHGHLSPIKSHLSATQISEKTRTPSKITLTKDWCGKSTVFELHSNPTCAACC